MPKLFLKVIAILLFASCSATKEKKIDNYVFKTKSERKDYINSYNAALKLWGIPYQEENIETSYGTAHIIVTGPKDGKDLVLLHGMDASSTMWFPNIKALSKNHRVYAIDFLIEAGKSQAPKKSLTSEEIVIWYNEIFTHYKLKNFDVIGASRGGWIATLLATQKESKINKLVLISPAQTFKNIDKMRKASSAFFLKIFPNEKKLKKTLETFSYYPEKIDPIYKKQFYLANKYAKSNTSFLQMQPFSDEDLKKITIPVLVLIGDHDVINSDESIIRAKELLSNSKTETIENAGHFLSIDQSEKVNKLMIDFLK
ncbi:alpha/beta hydrolase [Flavobacterium sp. KMS]|uniref:alpha/beta fold hydrolase n=1 Tax=Flavobacterium sp. KMS TaxID=1566023 RepID=UPI00057F4B0A|nr:alpha/beta hydrolase [Flavobacterium sp. KMS]KIA94677.1 alpha/beta hydrolase [Flavobacterium sp. KMS]